MSDLFLDFGWLKENFECNGYLYFTGQDHSNHYKLYNSLQVAVQRKTMKEEAENYFGTTQMVLNFGGKDLCSKNCKHIFIDSVEDFNKYIFQSKDSFINEILSSLSSNKKVQDVLIEVENNLMFLEEIINKELRKNTSNINFFLKNILFEEVIKNMFICQTFENGKPIVPMYQNLSIQIINLCNLIDIYLKGNSNQCWFHVYYPSTFCMKNEQELLMKRLKELMLKYNNFHVIIIDSQLFVTDCSHEDIESMVVMNGGNIDQLPPYYVIRNLIEGNYPSEKNFSDEDLISMLISIIPILGSDNYNNLSPRQHIFVNLLNYIVYGIKRKEYICDVLDPLEKIYLESIAK